MRTASLAVGVAAAVFASAATAEEKGATAARAELVAVIDAALKADASPGVLRETARRVLDASPANVLVAEALGPVAADEAGAEALRDALRKARGLLAFEVEREAPLPEGFPEPTPVGEIRVKSYPAYRLARTPSGLSQNVAFFTLFGHIQSRDIAMTAPVELTYGAGDGGRPKEESMAFLYRRTTQGEAGKAGLVEVADVPAATTVALGLPGEFTPDRIADARGRLEAWLKGHPAYEPAGPLRVLGYNGPNVPKDRRYFEVEIPVREAAK